MRKMWRLLEQNHQAHRGKLGGDGMLRRARVKSAPPGSISIGETKGGWKRKDFLVATFGASGGFDPHGESSV